MLPLRYMSLNSSIGIRSRLRRWIICCARCRSLVNGIVTAKYCACPSFAMIPYSFENRVLSRLYSTSPFMPQFPVSKHTRQSGRPVPAALDDRLLDVQKLSLIPADLHSPICHPTHGTMLLKVSFLFLVFSPLSCLLLLPKLLSSEVHRVDISELLPQHSIERHSMLGSGVRLGVSRFLWCLSSGKSPFFLLADSSLWHFSPFFSTFDLTRPLLTISDYLCPHFSFFQMLSRCFLKGFFSNYTIDAPPFHK